MSAHGTLNPTGGVVTGNGVESPNPDDNLRERILAHGNRQDAWRRAMRSVQRFLEYILKPRINQDRGSTGTTCSPHGRFQS